MMKICYTLLVLTFTFTCTFAQSLEGAWEHLTENESGDTIRSVVIFAGAYQAMATFNLSQGGAFIGTNGGKWQMEGRKITEWIEFDTQKPERVGTSRTFEVIYSADELSIVGSGQLWTRIDDGTPGALAGAWLISGRMENGEVVKRNTDVPRKTMKILSGTRFQWIAYNTQTGEFFGTGGGTYTTANGQYTETIDFFSRDNSRVGAVLSFDFSLQEGAWYHSGFSSKGDAIYEIWEKRVR